MLYLAKEKIQWHPAFASALQLEFKEYKDILTYTIEKELTQEPLKIDVVIVKKEKNVEIDKAIGRILRKYNIFEYKSPTDYLSIDDYYKVKAYAYLYKVIEKGENSIDIDEMTITLTSTRYPKKLMNYLEEKKIIVEKVQKGIYYIKGTSIDTQILVIKEMQEEDTRYLALLQQQHENQRVLRNWMIEYLSHGKDPLYEVIMSVLEKNNLDEIMEVFKQMGIPKISKENEAFLLNAIKELKIDERLKKEGMREGIKEGIKEGIEERNYQIARKMLMRGTDIDSVIDITELTREEVERLIKEMQ